MGKEDGGKGAVITKGIRRQGLRTRCVVRVFVLDGNYLHWKASTPFVAAFPHLSNASICTTPTSPTCQPHKSALEYLGYVEYPEVLSRGRCRRLLSTKRDRAA